MSIPGGCLKDFQMLCRERQLLQDRLKDVNRAINVHRVRFLDTMDEGNNFQLGRETYTKRTVPTKQRLSQRHLDNSAIQFIRDNPRTEHIVKEYLSFIEDSRQISHVDKLQKRTIKNQE